MPLNSIDTVTAKDSFREIGTSGLKQTGGWIHEDPVPKLSSLNKRMKTYKQMVHDPVIGAILFAIEMHLRKTKWRSTSKEGESTPESEFLEDCLEDMNQTFPDFMSEVLSMLPYGFSLHEIVYKYRTDGMIGWNKLAVRSQDSIQRWEFNSTDDLLGVWQYGKKAQINYIPFNKFLLFRPNSYKGNPEGKSVLRNAYRSYYFKRKIEMIEAIGAERDLSGYPVLHVPNDIFAQNDLAQEQRSYAKKIVTRVRKDEQMGAVLPPEWELELLSSTGKSSTDTDKIIGRYNLQIAQSLLSDIIMLGHTSSGSYALSEKKYELFLTALDSWLDSIEAVINEHAVPRLMRLNGYWDKSKYPLLKHDPASEIDPQKLANVLFRLVKVNTIKADEALEKYLRNFLGLPAPDKDTSDDYPNLDELGRTAPENTDNKDRESTNTTRPADSEGSYTQSEIGYD